MASLNHTHSWVKLKRRIHRRMESVMRDGEQMYKCAHPDCTSIQPHSLVKDKSSSCPGCGDSFILTWRALELVTPVCENCRDDREAREKRAAKELISQIVTKAIPVVEPEKILTKEEQDEMLEDILLGRKRRDDASS